MRIEQGTNKGRRIHHITMGNVKLSALMVMEPGIRRIEKVSIETKDPKQKIVLTDIQECQTVVRGLIALDKDIEEQIKRLAIKNEY